MNFLSRSSCSSGCSSARSVPDFSIRSSFHAPAQRAKVPLGLLHHGLFPRSRIPLQVACSIKPNETQVGGCFSISSFVFAAKCRNPACLRTSSCTGASVQGPAIPDTHPSVGIVSPSSFRRTNFLNVFSRNRSHAEHVKERSVRQRGFGSDEFDEEPDHALRGVVRTHLEGQLRGLQPSIGLNPAASSYSHPSWRSFPRSRSFCFKRVFS